MIAKRIAASVLGIVFLFGFFLPSAMAKEDVIVWRLGHPESPDIYNQFCHTMSVVFKDIMENRTAGHVKIEIYHSGQLGKDQEMTEQVKTGTLQFTTTGEGGITPFYSKIQVLLIPYLFKSEAVAWEVVDGPFGKALYDDMAKETGLRVISTGRGTFRNFTNRAHPIRTPADLKGIKFRTMTVPLTMEMVKAYGAAATPIPWPDLYNALKMGVVDGQENPISVIVGGKLYEVQKYMTVNGHQFGGNYIVVNEKWFQSLAPSLKSAMKDAAYIAGIAGRGAATVGNSVGLDFLKEKGMEIYLPSGTELAEFRKVGQPPVIDWWVKNLDRDRKWLNAITKATKDAEDKLGITH